MTLLHCICGVPIDAQLYINRHFSQFEVTKFFIEDLRSVNYLVQTCTRIVCFDGQE